MNQLLTLPDSFGPALRFLRKRARLTQDELGRAVAGSREQIARLENGSRLPIWPSLPPCLCPRCCLNATAPWWSSFWRWPGKPGANGRLPSPTPNRRASNWCRKP
ncbi:MAG: helix-turn-helix transcriptional regulator [Anaerolineaceae bacterium]|nr:helix-turn-helix transcriptional regulator [Anaerolineaceae bacterium]